LYELATISKVITYLEFLIDNKLLGSKNRRKKRSRIWLSACMQQMQRREHGAAEAGLLEYGRADSPQRLERTESARVAAMHQLLK